MKTTIILTLSILFSIITINAFSQNTENLLGLKLNYESQEVILSVVTTGCTQKSDFKFTVKNDTLTIIRIKEDNCKAMARETTFSYSFQAAGINPNKTFTIKNSFIGNPLLTDLK